MAISRMDVLERRKKLEAQKQKSEAKIKALQDKLKEAQRKISETDKREEADRAMIAGQWLLGSIKMDASLKEWFEKEIEVSLKSNYDRSLFGLNPKRENR